MRTEFPVSDAGILKLKIQILRELSAAPYPREALPLLAAKHGITVDDAKALVERHGWPDAAAMGRAAEVLDGNAPPPSKTPANGAPTRAVRPAEPSWTPPASGTEQLITSGEKSAKARTRRLAAKVREDLKELRELVIAERKEAEAAKVKAEETARLKAEVADLERQLAQKKAALRPAGAKPKAKRTEDAKQIRAWAAAQGIDCPALGRLPVDVVMEYRRAHTTEGEA